MDLTPEQPGEGVAPRIIKRYANRKLYDTQDSRYVTLQQIAEFVRAGEDVKIIDNRSKEDLTKVTLAQIIYDEEKKGGETRSIGSLRSFIQQGRQRIEEGRERLIESFQKGPVGKVLSRTGGGEGEDQFDAGVDAGDAASDPPKTETRSVMSSPKEALEELQRLADDRVRGLVSMAMTHVQQLQAEVKRLQARIEELEGKLGALGRRAKGERSASEQPPPSESATPIEAAPSPVGTVRED